MATLLLQAPVAAWQGCEFATEAHELTVLPVVG